jgi:hypothetical protein
VIFVVVCSTGVCGRDNQAGSRPESRVTARAKNPIVTQAFKAFIVEALSV